jgi:hypothetical protein
MASDSESDGSLAGPVSKSKDEEDDSSHRQKPEDKKKAFPRDKYRDSFKICGSRPDKDKRTDRAKTAAENFDAAEPNAVKFDDRRRDDDKWDRLQGSEK